MGPLELQLYRELAIHMVRECAERLRHDDESSPDLDWYRRWFVRTHDDWTTTPRAELGGLTPVEVIFDERAQCHEPSPLIELDAPQHVELYTDLPQAEEIGERIELAEDGLTSPAAADLFGAVERGIERGEPFGESSPELPAPRPAVDDPRWRAFYDRYLADWLDE